MIMELWPNSRHNVMIISGHDLAGRHVIVSFAADDHLG